MESLLKILAAVTVGMFLILVVACILALPVMLLWNFCLVGAITGVNAIGFWQALGLMILSGLLFKTSTNSPKSSK